MKTHPIIFTAHEVRATLAGRKMQFRRPIKLQPDAIDDLTLGIYAPTKIDRYGMEYPGDLVYGLSNEEAGYPSPYAPGDRPWVKESLIVRIRAWQQSHGRQWSRYGLDWSDIEHENLRELHGVRARSMPRWASRLTLEILSVRPERLQEISERDAILEGVSPLPATSKKYRPYICSFLASWDDRYGKRNGGIYAWAKSPWVWRYEFRRVEG